MMTHFWAKLGVDTARLTFNWIHDIIRYLEKANLKSTNSETAQIKLAYRENIFLPKFSDISLT